MKLTAKLILIVSAALALLTCASGYLSARQQFNSFQQAHEDQARDLKRRASQQLRDAWEEQGRPGVEEVLAGMPVEVRHTKIRWVQFDASPDHPDSPWAPQSELQRVTAGEIESVVTRNATGEGWLRTYVPIEVAASHPAGVELSESLAEPDEQRRCTIWSTLATLAGLALVSLGVIVVAGVELVGKPLQKLLAKTQQIGAGNFAQPVAMRGNDELAQLGSALNQMSDQLQHQQQEIESEAASRLAALSQLRHADRLKTVGRLAAGIAHEVGTPLNVVAGRAGLIASGRLSAEEIKDSAKTIKGEADRIAAIIRQLLDFARRTTLEKRAVDLCVVVERTVGLLQSFARAQQVELEVQSSEKTLLVSIDEGQIQQVLTNIIMNGIQSINGAGTVSVALGERSLTSPDQAESCARTFAFVEVRDDGSGIDAENQNQLFEPFFTTKDVGEGTGLGLSIAYGIVQEHDGWIDVESQPESGSCFTVFLPHEAPLSAESEQSEQSHQHAGLRQ